MAYNVLELSKYIINYCYEKKWYMNVLKLQCLLYFIQARFLTEKEKPCFEEKIEAWDWGAVCPSVYYYFMNRGFGANSIFPCYISSPDIKFEKQDKIIIDNSLDTLGGLQSYQLSDIIKEQPPWIEAHQKEKVISNNTIIIYFSSIQDKEPDDSPQP